MSVLKFLEIVRNCFDFFFVEDFDGFLLLEMGLVGCHCRGNEMERKWRISGFFGEAKREVYVCKSNNCKAYSFSTIYRSVTGQDQFLWSNMPDIVDFRIGMRVKLDFTVN